MKESQEILFKTSKNIPFFGILMGVTSIIVFLIFFRYIIFSPSDIELSGWIIFPPLSILLIWGTLWGFMIDITDNVKIFNDRVEIVPTFSFIIRKNRKVTIDNDNIERVEPPNRFILKEHIPHWYVRKKGGGWLNHHVRIRYGILDFHNRREMRKIMETRYKLQGSLNLKNV